MWGNSHRTSTLKAFDILNSLGNSSWETHKLTIAEKNVEAVQAQIRAIEKRTLPIVRQALYFRRWDLGA